MSDSKLVRPATTAHPPRKRVSDEARDTLLEFTLSYLLELPTDIDTYARDFFSKMRESKHPFLQKDRATSISHSTLHSSSSKHARRSLVKKSVMFADSLDAEADKPFVKPVHSKTPEEFEMLRKVVKATLIFSVLDDSQVGDIVNAMFKRTVSPREMIIKQGDEGDNFYIIQSGIFSVLQAKPMQRPKLIMTYENEGIFGELALLYKQPRAATVIAQTEGIIWALDKATFRMIVLKAAHEKRKVYEKFVSIIPILTHLGEYEKLSIVDLLVQKTFKAGEVIYKVGDKADGIYFIEKGGVHIRLRNRWSEEIELDHYGKYGYFGEIELLEDNPRRVTTAYAERDSTLAFLDIKSYEKFMGPSLDAMRTRSQNYKLRLKRTPGFSLDNLLTFEDFAGCIPRVEQVESSDDSLPAARSRQRRAVVYGESYNPEAAGENFVKVVHPKTDEEHVTLENIAKQTLLFRTLDEEQLDDVINAMFKKETKPGDVIIKQGDDGDAFYVIQRGIFDAFMTTPDNKEEHLFTYEHKGHFGELALLYNQPRAATVISKTEGVIWGLERETFRTLVMQSSHKRREMYENFIKKVPILTELGEYERLNIADVLIPKKFKKGAIIFRQGTKADGMYFVESGCVSVKVRSLRGIETEIEKLREGSYFGEMALINDRPRIASVYATEETRLAFLDAEAFERFMGPCIELMKRNIENYQIQMERIIGSAMFA